LPDGSVVRLTVQKYFTPAGRCIQKPYEEGKDDYYQDYAKRLERGEFFSASSIQFPDSLKFATQISKRTVYGGGGIMPDVFVPLDTTENSRYFSDIIRVGVQSEWALTYVNAQREQLLSQFPTVHDFVSKYQIPASEEQKVIDMAVAKEVPFDEKGYQTSRHAILVRSKALVARDLYENEAFYEVINDLNPALKKAVEVLQNGEYDQMPLDSKANPKKKSDKKK
jgi:carboxyl-terminal processing protease